MVIAFLRGGLALTVESNSFRRSFFPAGIGTADSMY